MSYAIDYKYINMLSPRLERFGWKKKNVAICRCPMCGDSSRNKAKKRFYFYEDKSKFYVKCHNCSYCTVFGKFLEYMDGNLYKEYSLETFRDLNPIKEKKRETDFSDSKPVFKKKSAIEIALQGIQNLKDLPDVHPAKKYILHRGIPDKFISLLYYTDDFGSLSKKIDPESKLRRGESRIVIPFYNKKGIPFAIQGRSLDPNNSLRYITIRDPEYKNHPKVFGMERLDATKKVYVVEGPFDSLFLDNAIAMGGIDISKNALPKNFVMVLDNENRNREVLRKYHSIIEKGASICIFPEGTRGKDINEMVKNGVKNIQQIIDNNTYSDLAAMLKFNEWCKVGI